MSDLGTARGRIEVDSSGAVQGFRKARDEGQTTFNQLEAASGAMITAGAAVAGLGAAMLGGIGLAVKASADFEAQLSRFRSVSGATADEMDLISEKALQIGRDTSFGAGEAAGALVELSKAGISVAEVLEGAADATIALAEAGEIDVAQAASIAAAALNTFNLEASEMDNVANSLVGTANNSATTVAELGVAMQNAGASAAVMGVPLEDLNVGLGILAGRGITGSKAGTTLNRMLLNLQPSSDKARSAMEELGLITEDGSNQFFDAEGNLKSLSEVSELLQTSLADLTSEQKAMALETIFGTRAIAAASALAESGAEGFNELADAIGEVDAADVAAEKLDNLSGAFTILKGTIETALISAGSPFQEALTGIVRGVTNVINAFASMNPNIQRAIVFVIAGVGAFLLFAGTTLMMVGTTIKFIAVAKQLAPVFGLIRAGFAAATKGALVFFKVLLANPIFLIIAAVVALAILIYKYWDEIVEFIGNAWEHIKDFASRALDWIKDAIARFVPAAIKFFQELPGKIADFFRELPRRIGEFLGLVILTLIQWQLSMLQKAIEFGSQFLTAVLEFFRELPDRMGQLLLRAVVRMVVWQAQMLAKAIEVGKSVLDAVVNFFQQLPSRIGFFAGRAVRAFINLFTNIIPAIIGILSDVISNAVSWGEDMVDTAQDTARDFLDKVIEWLSELPGRVWEWLSDSLVRAATWYGEMVLKAAQMGRDFIDSVIDFFKNLPGRIQEWFVEAVARGAAWVLSMKAKAEETGQAVITAIVDFFQQLPGRAAEFFTEMVQRIAQFVTTARNRAREVAQSVMDAIRDILTGLPDLVMGLVGRAIRAIRSMATQAFNSARKVASDMWSGFKSGLGISSPSFIEEAMFTITHTVGDEASKLGGHVKDLQRLGNNLMSDSAVQAMLQPADVRSEIMSRSLPAAAGVGGGGAARMGPMDLTIDLGEGISRRIRIEQDEHDEWFAEELRE